jgi:predicted dehydrogenase
VATLLMTFDVWAANLPRLEIYGSEGSLSLPDPNAFGGPVRRAARGEAWQDVPLTHGYIANSRGLGLADLAAAIQSGRPHRAGAELAYHVLDVMCAIGEASTTGRHIEIASTCARPAPLPPGLAEGEIDS